MKLEELNRKINLDLTLPMKVKVNSSNDVKIGDIIGYNALSGWQCAIVDEIISNKIFGYFIHCNNKIDLEILKNANAGNSIRKNVTFRTDYMQKYVVRLLN